MAKTKILSVPIEEELAKFLQLQELKQKIPMEEIVRRALRQYQQNINRKR